MKLRNKLGYTKTMCILTVSFLKNWFTRKIGQFSPPKTDSKTALIKLPNYKTLPYALASYLNCFFFFFFFFCWGSPWGRNVLFVFNKIFFLRSFWSPILKFLHYRIVRSCSLCHRSAQNKMDSTVNMTSRALVISVNAACILSSAE